MLQSALSVTIHLFAYILFYYLYGKIATLQPYDFLTRIEI